MSEFLSVPVKKPTDVDLIKPLKNIISSQYSTSDNPETYNSAIEEFNKLRTQAVWKVYEKYESSLEIVYCYYDELVSLDAKLAGSSPQIPFKWKDAFDKGSLFSGRASLTLSSFKYEIICVLFNIGALQSAVASTQLVETDEGLKLAAKLFQLAAGIYKHIKETVCESFPQDLTPDLNTEVLSSLTYLMLAQAQEIFVLKAIHDQMKDAVIAKLCAQCAEYYSDTFKLMQKERVGTLMSPSYQSLVIGKQQIFQGLAEYYQSLVCKAAKEIGQQIARLQAAISHIKAGQQSSAKNLYQDYLTKAYRDLTEAEKDNNFIYHEAVPDIKTLNPIAKAAIAKPTPLPSRLSSNFQDLFSSLMPVVVHQAMAAYDVRKTELMNVEVNKLRESTQLLNSVLASLNLPAALEDTTGLTVPPSVIEKSEQVQREGGIKKIETMLQELPDLLQCNQEILNETEKMMVEEKMSDDTLRAQFKEKWTRPESLKLTESIRSNLETYKQMIATATSADTTVREKYNKNKRAIELLSAGKDEIEKAIPSGGGSGVSGNSSAIVNLKRLMEEVETIKAERDAIESDLKSVTFDMKSTFLNALAQDGAINEAGLSNENLAHTYGSLQKQVSESLKKQETLLSNIQTQNTEFCKEKNNCLASIHRENFLKELASGYDAYSELVKNLEEGNNFYKVLTEHLINFQNKVTDFCFARKTEKEELLRSLTQEASRVPSTANAPMPPMPAPAPEKKEPPPRPPAPSVGGGNVHVDGTKTLPYPVQPMGMPIPFGMAAPFPYPPPTMPAQYNPYATLPQMHCYPPYQGQSYPQQQYQTYPYYHQPPQQ